MFASVLVSFNKFVKNASRQGNVALALTLWRHLVDHWNEAMNALHRAMRIAPYRPGGMAIKIVVDLPALFVIVNSMIAHQSVQ